MQVHGQGIHYGDLAGLGPYQSGEHLRQFIAEVDPGGLAPEMTADCQVPPTLHLGIERGRGSAWLQPQRVATQVSLVTALWPLRYPEVVAKAAQIILAVQFASAVQ